MAERGDEGDLTGGKRICIQIVKCVILFQRGVICIESEKVVLWEFQIII